MKFRTLIMISAVLTLGVGVLCGCQLCQDRRYYIIVVNPNDQSVTSRVSFRESDGRWVDSFPPRIIAAHGEVKECRRTPVAEERDVPNEIWIAEMNGREIFREKLSWHDLERKSFKIELPIVQSADADLVAADLLELAQELEEASEVAESETG